MKKSKEYIIVGSNNFWYAICDSEKDALSESKRIMKGLLDYSDPESGFIPDKPEGLSIYEAKLVTEI